MNHGEPIPSIFDDITWTPSPPPQISDLNGTLKHIETDTRNHNLTYGINMTTYPHKKRNYTTNIFI